MFPLEFVYIIIFHTSPSILVAMKFLRIKNSIILNFYNKQG